MRITNRKEKEIMIQRINYKRKKNQKERKKDREKEKRVRKKKQIKRYYERYIMYNFTLIIAVREEKRKIKVVFPIT